MRSSVMLRRESEQEARRRLRTTQQRMSAVLEKIELLEAKDELPSRVFVYEAC